jgi:hypothetical protein
MKSQRSSTGDLLSRKRPGTHDTGGWVGPRACLDRSGKPMSLEFDPRTIQPVASRYTDYAVPATEVPVGLHVKFQLYLSV